MTRVTSKLGKVSYPIDHLDMAKVKRPKGWGTRHTVAAMGFWAMCVMYALRFNLSIAIVDMVQPDVHDDLTVQGDTDSCDNSPHHHPLYHHVNGSGQFLNDSVVYWTVSDDHKSPIIIKDHVGRRRRSGEFNWTREEQGIIMGAYFWGHVLTQVPGSLIAQKYGTKWTIGLNLLLTACLTIATPWSARLGKGILIFVRILQGFLAGAVCPALHQLMAKWAPPDERSKLVNIVYMGPEFGTAVSTIACGYLIDWGFCGGWPSAFYVLGGFGIVWFILWCFLMHESPAHHPRISEKERNYIEKSIGEQASDDKHPTPWKAIALSVPVWALTITYVGEDWGFYTFLTELPTYMKTVLHFDIKQNSWMSALPQLVRCGSSFIWTYLADFLVHRKIMRVVTVRKICNTIGHWGAAAALIGMSYMGCDKFWTIVVLTVAVGLNGAVNGGCIVNHVDIAPNHAGVLLGITNTVANLCGIGAPYVAGLFINEKASRENWKLIFFLAAGIYFFDNLVYILFASGSEQPWNRSKEQQRLQIEKEANKANKAAAVGAETLNNVQIKLDINILDHHHQTNGTDKKDDQGQTGASSSSHDDGVIQVNMDDSRSH